MKKIFSVLAFLAVCFVADAQVPIPKSVTAAIPKDFVKPPAIGDITKTSKSIADLLGSKLSLPTAKVPLVNDAVAGFLKDKKGILGLATSNPTEYLSKFNPLQGDLFGKLKGIMGSTAFSKFLGLKPSGSDITGNLLSNLFF